MADASMVPSSATSTLPVQSDAHGGALPATVLLPVFFVQTDMLDVAYDEAIVVELDLHVVPLIFVAAAQAAPPIWRHPPTAACDT